MMRLRALRFENPVALREMRMRMRGGRAYLLMFGYVLVLSLVIFLGYVSLFGSGDDRHLSVDPMLGQTLFYWLYGFQVALIALTMPGLTAWLISSEREQQTLDLLVSTLLTPQAIVAGKLLPALAFLALLLFSSLPLAMFCLVFGGLSPSSVLTGYSGLFIYGFVVACIGIACSSLLHRSFAATITAYLLTLGYSIGWLFLLGLFEMIGDSGLSGTFGWLGFAAGPGWVAGVAQERERMAPLFGLLDLPTIALSVIVNGVLGLLLMTIAAANIPHCREDRAPTIRGLLIAYTTLVILATVGGSFGKGLNATASRGALAFILAGAALVATAFAPSFAAAPFATDRRSLPKMILDGLTGQRWLRTDAGGGFWFALILAVSMLTVAVLSIVIAGADGRHFWSQTLHLSAVALSMTAASAAMGILFYAMTGQAILARAITFTIIAVDAAVTSGVWFALGGAFGAQALPSGAWIRYFSLLAPFNEWGSQSVRVSRAAALSSTHAITYLAAAILMLALASVIYRKRWAWATAEMTTSTVGSAPPPPPVAVLE